MLGGEMQEVIIVGAGLSGLSCALELQANNRKVLVLEQSDGPGGRVRTDEVDGYLLDRGFQVYLDAYPIAGQVFDLPDLKLSAFEPGAMVFSEGKLHRFMDAFRRPRYLFASVFAPVGNFFDKVMLARLRTRLLHLPIDKITENEDLVTTDYLRRHGFSERMIDGFFRSFYGGIFLERDLRTSSRMFEFTFKMFAQGLATLPAKGMGQLPEQLASRLGQDQIQYNTKVASISGNEVHLQNGKILAAHSVVVATPPDTAKRLLPSLQMPSTAWRSTTNLYFSADKSPLNEPVLALNGEKTGLVNSVAVLSDVCPSYAPEGKALISVSLLGIPEQDDLPKLVSQELTKWFGSEVLTWTHLRTDTIPCALPEQTPDSSPCPQPPPPHFLCGDYQISTSIEGAIISGQETAQKILAQ